MIASFKGGLISLPEAIARQLGPERIALGQSLKSITKNDGDGYRQDVVWLSHMC